VLDHKPVAQRNPVVARDDQDRVDAGAHRQADVAVSRLLQVHGLGPCIVESAARDVDQRPWPMRRIR